MNEPKALLFDIFGTVVDWRSGVARAAEDLLAPLGHRLDWQAFADAWRAEYQPAMHRVRSGDMPFSRLDVLHRANLESILPGFGLASLSEESRQALNLAWHQLDGWPDAAPGLARLRAKFRLAPCSNGHIALMVDIARRNGFVWDAILGAEIAGSYKPMPRVYLSAVEAIGLEPHECMMVAAHSNDLKAAAACGLRTAFIARPDEKGPGNGESHARVAVDIEAANLVALADALGA
jgi:2-haloacid dehalogenase